ncbi:hypothetical protein AC249_AIPGENE19297 [Exaiptasia diaphana]|nr:hypothetical protein AC249_AIPGENE19297 [Exaiptasia diaphana]
MPAMQAKENSENTKSEIEPLVAAIRELSLQVSTIKKEQETLKGHLENSKPAFTYEMHEQVTDPPISDQAAFTAKQPSRLLSEKHTKCKFYKENFT